MAYTAVETHSRFAVLHQDDSEDEDGLQTKAAAEIKSNAAKNAKKRARKKKKAAAESASTNELRNLAFSKSVSAKVIQNVHQQRHQLPDSAEPNRPIAPPSISRPPGVSHPPVENFDPNSWEQWMNKDEKYVVDQFQKDLETALRLSEGDGKQKNSSNPTKRKNTKKQPTMSLEEFSNITIVDSTTSNNHAAVRPRNGYCPDEIDPNHYQYEVPLEETPHLSKETPTTNNKKKKKKKKIALSDILTELHKDEGNNEQEVNNQHSGVDAASFASWQNDIEKKNAEITELKTLVNKLKEEVAQVKKRNKQLCFILAQGEMKDKSEILLQVDELTNIKNELSEELTEMHSALEQERSKVSSLKVELTKHQGSRTKSKSMSEEK